VALVVLAAACSPGLPDADTPGARVLQARCGGCHRLYPPASMTAEMWKFQVARMRGEFSRRGMPWLTPEEERVLLDYLLAHAGRE
jgi:hypothetical protein